jgi:hypothetical protein
MAIRRGLSTVTTHSRFHMSRLRHLLFALTAFGLLTSIPAVLGQTKPPEKPVEKPPEKTTDKPPEKPPTPKPEEKDIKVEKITFNSADGVELQGSFYVSVKGGGSPSVILMHATGKEPNIGDWAGLAKSLAARGFNVLRFDFRGHGSSTNFDKNLFWDPLLGNLSAFPALAKKKPVPEKFDMKDILAAKGNYLPALANDIMAARIALDKMNDAGKTNTGSTYLIGAGDAAGIGMLFMTAEWTRPQTVPQAHNLSSIPPQAYEIPRGSDYAGKDIAGAIWLSPSLPKGLDANLMKKWVKSYPELREKNPVYCLYGAEDAVSKSNSNMLVNDVLEALPRSKDINKLPFTKAEAIPGTKVRGVDLLGSQLGTEDKIFKQLEVLETDRKNVIATPNRNFTKPSILLLSYFGVK